MRRLERPKARLFLSLVALAAFGCGDDNDAAVAGGGIRPPAGGVRYRGDVEPVRSAAAAQPGVFVPSYLDCRDPPPGETGASEGGQVCTQVLISGATEPGKYYPDYASCDVVRTQRPYRPVPPAGATRADDPRLQDQAFLAELAWVTEQARASACTCCHDTKIAPAGASQWAIDAGPIWTDTASDRAIGFFAGLSDSSVLGFFRPEDNNGFNRELVGLPSTDPPRMQAFFRAELARRGIAEEEAAEYVFAPLPQLPPPGPCAAGEGLDASGRLVWGEGKEARYVYVLEAGSAVPAVPPYGDAPAGMVWRLDVLASAAPLAGGVGYGETPDGSFQAHPDGTAAPALRPGTTYHLVVLRDVARPLVSCLFTP